MALDYCEFEPFYTPYIELTASLITFLLLQIWLLIHTCYYEFRAYKKKRDLQSTKLSIRVSFIILQLCSLYWLLVDFIRMVIDPWFNFLPKHEFACSWLSYSPKVICIIYLSAWLHQIALRLQLSFKGSHLAVTKKQWTWLILLIFFPAVSFPVSFFVTINGPYAQDPCLYIWEPIDINVTDFAICDYNIWEGAIYYIVALGIMWNVAANVIIGFIFTLKLKKVLAMTSSGQDKKSSFKLKSLIIKNTILTAFGAITTIINWFMWVAFMNTNGIGIFFLYLDIWLNCFLLSLMFKYNEKYYKKLCKLCITCCFMDCDKTYDRRDTKQWKAQRQATMLYLNLDGIGTDGSSDNKSSNRDNSAMFTQSTQSCTQSGVGVGNKPNIDMHRLRIPSTSPDTVPSNADIGNHMDSDNLWIDASVIQANGPRISPRITPMPGSMNVNNIGIQNNNRLTTSANVMGYQLTLQVTPAPSAGSAQTTPAASPIPDSDGRLRIAHFPGIDTKPDPENDHKHGKGAVNVSATMDSVLNLEAILNERTENDESMTNTHGQENENEADIVYEEDENSKSTEPRKMTLNDAGTVMVYDEDSVSEQKTESFGMDNPARMRKMDGAKPPRRSFEKMRSNSESSELDDNYHKMGLSDSIDINAMVVSVLDSRDKEKEANHVNNKNNRDSRSILDIDVILEENQMDETVTIVKDSKHVSRENNNNQVSTSFASSILDVDTILVDEDGENVNI